MDRFSIGQLAKTANVNIQTVRYYERRGLMPEPVRRDSGYRQYDHSDIVRLRFIKRAQELGFSLTEIAELLSLRVDPETTCGDVKQEAEAKILDIESKIQSLKRMKAALSKLSAACNGKNPRSACPILEYLNLEDDSRE